VSVKKIELELAIVVGAVEMPLARILQLGRGAVIALGRDASEPLTILANGAPVAKGRVKLNGEKVTVEITQPPFAADRLGAG